MPRADHLRKKRHTAAALHHVVVVRSACNPSARTCRMSNSLTEQTSMVINRQLTLAYQMARASRVQVLTDSQDQPW
jgi:hypothetical protein